jgi:hypothetical protein
VAVASGLPAWQHIRSNATMLSVILMDDFQQIHGGPQISLCPHLLASVNLLEKKPVSPKWMP